MSLEEALGRLSLTGGAVRLRVLPEETDKPTCMVSLSILEQLGIASGDLVEIQPNLYSRVQAMAGLPQDGMVVKASLKGLLVALEEGRGFVKVARLSMDTVAQSAGSLCLRVPKGSKLSPVQQALLRRELMEQGPLAVGMQIPFYVSLTARHPTTLTIQAMDPPAKPGCFVLCNQATRLEFAPENLDPAVMEDEVFLGQEALLKEILATIRDPIDHAEDYQRLGLRLPRGLLLWGPPGTGKSSLVRRVVRELGWHAIQLEAASLLSQWWGDSEARLQAVFAEAKAHAPSLLIIDEIDALFPPRNTGGGEADGVDSRLVAAFLTQLDGIEGANCHGNGIEDGSKGAHGHGGIEGETAGGRRFSFFVLATTNAPHRVDPAIRRPGRLDREFEVEPPGLGERRSILGRLATPDRLEVDVDLDWLALSTSGFVLADLACLWKEAVFARLRRLPSQAKEETLPTIRVSQADLEQALSVVRPSGLREVAVAAERPQGGLKLGDLAGIDTIRTAIEHAILGPMREAARYAQFGIRPAKGLLLYGPPGCSKTMTSRAIATELGLNFIAVRGPELLRKWVGETEKAIGDLFRRARLAQPCVIFFDEFDGMFQSSKSQDRLVTQLLTELDGIREGVQVFVIAATNRPDAIDASVLRSGRFDHFIYAGLPTEVERLAIIQRLQGQYRLESDFEGRVLAGETAGYTHAELAHIFNTAAMRALQRDARAEAIQMADLLAAARTHRPQITQQTLDYYQRFSKIL